MNVCVCVWTLDSLLNCLVIWRPICLCVVYMCIIAKSTTLEYVKLIYSNETLIKSIDIDHLCWEGD